MKQKLLMYGQASLIMAAIAIIVISVTYAQGSSKKVSIFTPVVIEGRFRNYYGPNEGC